jgi:hypothetical protein
MRVRFVLCLLISLLMATQFAFSQGKKDYTEKPSRRFNTEQRGTEKEPFVVRVLPSEEAQAETAIHKQETDEKAKNDVDLTRYTGWLALITAFLFIVAIIQAGLFYWQLVLIRGSLGDTQVAARAAADSARTMKTTAQRQLRAYVCVEGLQIGNVANPPQPQRGQKIIPTVAHIHRPLDGPLINLALKNFGQTPASETTFWAEVLFREYPLSSPLPSRPPRNHASQFIVPPTGIIRLDRAMPQPLSSQEKAALISVPPTGAIYVFGEVSYKDIFKRSRWTKFCYFYNGISGIVGLNTMGTGYESGNETDTDSELDADLAT